MSSREPLVVAVLGLGEAGSEIAAGLCAAGAVVRGFDPRVPAADGVTACTGDADACRGAAVVVSLTCAHEAEGALTAALPAMRTGASYADLNTASSAPASWPVPRPRRWTGWSRGACGTRCGGSTRWPRPASSCAGSACRRGWPAQASSGCGNWRRSKVPPGLSAVRRAVHRRR